MWRGSERTMADASIPDQPGTGRISKAENSSKALWIMKIMPSISVSATAPASGFIGRNAAAAMDRRPSRSAPKNGPAPWKEKEPANATMPEISRIQPMNTVATNVETIGKMTAPMPSTSSRRQAKTAGRRRCAGGRETSCRGRPYRSWKSLPSRIVVRRRPWSFHRPARWVNPCLYESEDRSPG